MRRRKFVALLGGVVAAWPFAARAQHGGKIPRVGFMGNSTAALEANLIGSFLVRTQNLPVFQKEKPTPLTLPGISRT